MSKSAKGICPSDSSRPRYHFTPPENWMNDPNGLICLDGEYHLFYQHNPLANSWGNMSWGHAVSRDLVHWEHCPVAIWHEDSMDIYSGTAIFDRSDSSGLGSGGQGPLVAFFTGHHTKTGEQDQRIAFSRDRGRSWTKYVGNPVIAAIGKDFRDPKVFWHEQSGKWVMAVAIPTDRLIRFYSSENLVAWKRESDFGQKGSVKGIWECPDIFPLQAKDDPSGEILWVLVVSVNPGGPSGGSGVQYFIGEFDGCRFISEQEGPRWLDLGKDFYAAQTFENMDDDRRVSLAWMNNWDYAHLEQSEHWKGMMTIPRELSLSYIDDRIQLLQHPVVELQSLRKPIMSLASLALDAKGVVLDGIVGAAFEASFTVDMEGADTFHLDLGGNGFEHLMLIYDKGTETLALDRGVSAFGQLTTNPSGTILTSKIPLESGSLVVQMFSDLSSVELFLQGGRFVVTNRVSLPEGAKRISIRASHGCAFVRNLDIWSLDNAMPDT